MYACMVKLIQYLAYKYKYTKFNLSTSVNNRNN